MIHLTADFFITNKLFILPYSNYGAYTFVTLGLQ